LNLNLIRRCMRSPSLFASTDTLKINRKKRSSMALALMISIGMYFAGPNSIAHAQTKQKTATSKTSASKSTAAKTTKATGKSGRSKQNINVQLRQSKNSAVGLSEQPAVSNETLVDLFGKRAPTPTSGFQNYSKFTIKNGCAKPTSSISRLIRNELDIRDNDFVDAFESQAPNFLKAESATCLPYSASLDSQRKIQAFSILNNEKRDKDTRLLTLNKSPTTGTYFVQSQDLSSGFSGYQEVELSLDDIVVYKANKATSAIPPELVWELSSLAKEIYAKNNPKDKRFVRVVFNTGDKNTWAQIVSLEILDATRTIVLADAFWVARDDITGGFFTSSGTELEQDFWINPLNYTRISRGVGSFAAKGKRSQVVKKGNKSVVVTRFYTSYSSHQGIDYAAPTGTPIYAVANGKVVFYGVMSGYGNLVVLEHPGGYRTYYAHLSAFNPELGVDSDVRRGLEIGYVGSTGRSTGPHLHFELRRNGVYMNPMSEKLEIDLWSLREQDQLELTRQIVLFSTLQQSGR